jgi:ribosomal protein S18 acetylase RimI-like enzyme
MGRSQNDRGFVEAIPYERADEVVAVLADAFHNYPVMRHVIGAGGSDYDARATTLTRFFVSARVFRGEPMLGVAEEGRLVAAAILTPPGVREPSPALAELRERVWGQLGKDSRERYEKLGRVWQAFAVPEANLHLNMIGVRSTHAGRGFGGLLLDAVHEMSHSDPESSGVTLTTEDPRNVTLYQRYGYEIVGHIQVAEGLETWGFYRPDPSLS